METTSEQQSCESHPKASAEGASSAELPPVIATGGSVKGASENGNSVRELAALGPETCDIEPREPAQVSLRTLLEAGAHFGHQTSRWNPKMAPYIYTVRNGIHIINLPLAIRKWEEARAAIVDVASRGGRVLFVGTKKQAQNSVIEEARRCGAFYVARRWLGGMLTNFQTIRRSIDRMNKLEQTLSEEESSMDEGKGSRFTKKERLMMTRELAKLSFSLSGIRTMHRAPDMVFVVDIKREEIAVCESRRLDIPVVAMVDTNCDPEDADYVIPSNDDGSRAISLFCQAVADAVIEGNRVFERRREQLKTAEEGQEEQKEEAEEVKEEKRESAAEKGAEGTEAEAPDADSEASTVGSDSESGSEEPLSKEKSASSDSE